MTSEVHNIYFDQNGFLQLSSLQGEDIAVVHPEGLIQSKHVFEGGRIVAGAFAAAVESGAVSVHVDLLSFSHPWSVQRWIVDDAGVCSQPREVTLAIEPPAGPDYLISPHLIEFLRMRGNDLEIYSLLRTLCGRSAAEDYFANCIASHGRQANASCRLVVIFNHHYIRNCRILHDYYFDRFPDIDFVLPCAAPDHPHYYSYPFGSFQFHGLIARYLQDHLRAGSLAADSYLFIQDDVLLHPRITAESTTELLSGDQAAWFPSVSKHDLESDASYWAPRIRHALRNQRDSEFGNGFEGLSSVISVQHLHRGFSDCFALSTELIPDFIHRLSPMVAANLFPEIAIPTALFNAVSSSGKRVARQSGFILWREQRTQVNNPEFIQAFISSEAAFLHPVKIAVDNGNVLKAIIDAYRRTS